MSRIMLLMKSEGSASEGGIFRAGERQDLERLYGRGIEYVFVEPAGLTPEQHHENCHRRRGGHREFDLVVLPRRTNVSGMPEFVPLPETLLLAPHARFDYRGLVRRLAQVSPTVDDPRWARLAPLIAA